MTCPRILFLVANDWYFYWHRAALAQRIAAAGYDVHVATPDGPYCAAIKSAGLHHHVIEMDRRGLNPLRDVAMIKRLVDLYRVLKPQLVHHVAIKPIIYGSIAAKITRVPAMVNAMPGMGYVFVSNELLARTLRPVVTTAFRHLLNAANSRLVLENGDDMQTWISRGVVRPDRVEVIHGCGVDTNQFRPTPEPPGPPLVILPARLLFAKGIAEFVAAARLLRQRSVTARFALVGGDLLGNPDSIPTRKLAEWQAEGVVELLGWHDDMPGLIAKSHIVCLPSYAEGLPRALLEAASCGRPIVATDVSGCRDVVRDGVNGLLVPAHQAAPLAEALARLIADAPLRQAMGARGRAIVLAEFSVERVAAETLRLYADLIGTNVAQETSALASIAGGAWDGESKS